MVESVYGIPAVAAARAARARPLLAKPGRKTPPGPRRRTPRCEARLPRSFGLHPGGLDDARPAFVVFFQECGEFGRRVRDGDRAQCPEPFLRLGLRQRLAHFLAEAIDYGGGRTGGGGPAPPPPGRPPTPRAPASQ